MHQSERWEKLIRGLEPFDQRERESVDLFLAAFRTLENPFDQDLDPTHVTASAAVIGPMGVLLHRHKRLGMWLQPGGHLDSPDEDPLEAAVRETCEETGLAVVPVTTELFAVDVHEGGRGHTHLDLRFLLHSDGQPQPPDGESQAVEWVAWTDPRVLKADGSLGGLLRKAKNWS